MQSKKHSVLESVTSTAIGFVINVTAQHLIFPLFGIYVAWHENIIIAIFFTVISIVRGYFVRRLFNLFTKQELRFSSSGDAKYEHHTSTNH